MKSILCLIAILTLSCGRSNFEASYIKSRDQQKTKYFKSKNFKGESEVEIGYAFFPVEKAKGVVVLLPGLRQSFEFYYEFIGSLNDLGFAVYAMDLRGIGRSTRLLENKQIVHIEDFQDYVSDVVNFLNNIVKQDNSIKGKKLFMFAHSLGGAVALEALNTIGENFSGVILNSPAFQLHFEKFGFAINEDTVLKTVSSADPKAYAPGYADVTIDSFTYEKSGAKLTSDMKRFNSQIAYMKENQSLMMGGASNSWLISMIKTGKVLRDPSKKYSYKTPVRIFQAGKDVLVENKTQNDICERLTDCKVIPFPKALHEIYREDDLIRNELLKNASEFFGI